MSIYINPGNDSFRVIRQGEYVDKSGLAAVVNTTIGMPNKLSCVSRPRRFGKSYAAQMLCAYYSKGCDSASLFDDLEVAKSPDYRKHMNRYNVLYLDIAGFVGENGWERLLESILKAVEKELSECFTGVQSGSVAQMLAQAVDIDRVGCKEYESPQFIAIIDEWDAPIRTEGITKELQQEYLEFLRSLFKNSQITNKVFAAAYMTGILPIKKDGSQSPLSEFREYSILSPGRFAPFIGFLEKDVKSLCEKYDMDFAEMRRWYDGYHLSGAGSVYNSNSVMEAIDWKKYRSYWQESALAGSMMKYINMDYQGLARVVVDLLGEKAVHMNPRKFKNDVTSFASGDDVLTLLTHFGYFSYDEDSSTISIPNEEIRQEFADYVHDVTHTETIRRVKESDELIDATIRRDERAVEEAFERIHTEEISPLHYNNEQSLRSVIKLGYFAYKDRYTQFEELPGGNGYADIVFLPKKKSDVPILIVELKWDNSAEGAIAQIRDKQYPAQLKNREEPILLVGVSYDKEDAQKKHHCRIELIESKLL